MRLLDRYLLRELLIPLSFCLIGFLIFLLFAELVTSLNSYQENHLTLRDVAELYAVKLPGLLALILPVALLLALLYTLTNHARHNEITAIRAAGVSLTRICAPYLAVGLLLMPVLFVINEYWVPDSADREQEIMHRHGTKLVGAPGSEEMGGGGFKNTRDGHNWNYLGYNRRTYEFKGPTVAWTSADGGNMWLQANRALWTNGAWTFYDVAEYGGKPGEELRPIEQTNEQVMPEFTETPDQVRREIQFARRSARTSLDSGEVPIAEILDYLDLHPRDLTPSLRRGLYTQLEGRLAAPLTCLVVVLIAIPFGAASGRRNLFAGVAVSIVICFIYFVLMKLGLALGTGGYLPPWLAAWFPNIAFSVASFWMMLRVR